MLIKDSMRNKIKVTCIHTYKELAFTFILFLFFFYFLLVFYFCAYYIYSMCEFNVMQ